MNQYQEQKAEDDFNSEMKELTKDLHHLLSTKQVRGVYNPNENYLPVGYLFLFGLFLAHKLMLAYEIKDIY